MLQFEHQVKWPAKLTLPGLVRWVAKHHDSDKLNFDAVEMLVTDGRRLFQLNGRCVSEMQSSAAIGSGAAWAEGYLRARPDDLKGAVEAACYYDPWCAGPVQEFGL